ncbi:MAG: UvrD-helicase domain-containing protein [Nitriliruptoraceae bacterium]
MNAATPTPAPGARARALHEEQVHLDAVADRVDALRRRAERHLAAAISDRDGSTFQARFERDVATKHHANRAARFTFGDIESLAFGRLDDVHGDRFHIGRVSVVDEDGEVLLVDWRAPAAAAFYRATPVHTEGVARRRTLITRGRHVQDLDDEILDLDAAERLGLETVSGQGALLAALSRARSTTMRDIVATIQAEQDEIIRAPARGTMVVTGGPGTGKTVVALHRVAYLLYEDRDRFEGRGVLVVGPSTAFTEYTARVLPALGEDSAVQRSIGSLAPAGVRAHDWDEPEVSQVKGSLAMVEVCRRLLVAAVPDLPPEFRFSVDGTSASVDGQRLRRLRERLLTGIDPDRTGATYLRLRRSADDALETMLWRVWSQARSHTAGRAPEDPRDVGFHSALAASPRMTMLRRCWWPDLDPEVMLAQLADGRISLDRVADGVLPVAARQTLAAGWEHADRWTVDDAALMDELSALVGTPELRRDDPEDDPGLRLTMDHGPREPPSVDVTAADYRDFAHVVVDEAQDLTPMQWRALSRRGPYASWTVVGDLAQRSRVGEPETWEQIAGLIGRRQVEIRRLEVNYRTPTEVAAVGRAVLEAAGHHPDAFPRTIRETGTRPRLVETRDVAAVALDTARAAVDEHGGTVVIVTPRGAVAPLQVRAGEHDGVVDGRLRVLDAREVKGLEFDDVVVVWPERILGGSTTGLHDLFVAVTRATRQLTIVTEPGVAFPGREHLEPVTVAERT